MSPQHLLRLSTALGTVVICVGLCGCGGDRFGSVKGTVRYKGKALPSGTVTFHTAKGGVETSQIRSDGTYLIPKVLVGETRISVQTPPLGRLPAPLAKALKEAGDDAPKVLQREKGLIVPSVPIPGRYNDPDTSDLTCHVQEGELTHDIDLTP